jgi:hypothetical protein
VESNAAQQLVRTMIREAWERAVGSGHQPVKPVVLFFDVDLTEVATINQEFPIQTVRGPVELPAEATNDASNLPQWSFFIDDLPQANWEHPCRYLFVHESEMEPKLTIVNETLPFSAEKNLAVFEVGGIFPEDFA